MLNLFLIYIFAIDISTVAGESGEKNRLNVDDRLKKILKVEYVVKEKSANN